MKHQPTFAIERDGERWYLVTRTPLVLPRPLQLSGWKIPRVAGLTERETEIFNLMARGKQNKEISNELHVPIRTVKFHASSIFRKTGCQDRYDLFRQFSPRGPAAIE